MKIFIVLIPYSDGSISICGAFDNIEDAEICLKEDSNYELHETELIK